MRGATYIAPEWHPDEARRNAAVARSGALTLMQRQALTPILQVLRKELDVGGAAISIVHRDTTVLIAASGFPTGVYDRATSFCAHAILRPDELMVVGDARRDDRFASNPYVDTEDGILFYAGMPLVDDGRMPLGTLCVFDGEPREALQPGEEAFLRRVSLAVTALLQRHACALA